MSIGADDMAAATVITLDGTGGYLSAVTDSAGYTSSPTEPGGNNGYRSAWWTLTAPATGRLIFDTQQTVAAGNGRDTLLTIIDPPTGNWLGFSDDEGGGTTSLTAVDVTAGQTILIRVSSYNDVAMGYVLRVLTETQYPTTFTARMTVRPMLHARGLLPFPDALDRLEISSRMRPSATLTVAAIVLNVPCAVSVWSAGAPSTLGPAAVRLVSPADDVVIPSGLPQTTIGVTGAAAGSRVQVDVSADGFATIAATGTGDIPRGVYGEALVTVPVAPALADGAVYQWRARLVSDIDAGAWTASRDLSVQALDGDAAVAGAWTVTTAAGITPHLWWADPPSARAGDTVVAVGRFGPGPWTVRLAGQATPATAAADVGATAGDARIDTTGRTTTVAHQRLTWTVPDVDPPGGALTVEAGA